MISINTNLSSLITQTNLANSTLGLNQAIERMTTGFKINHAKDNAANYSISTNLSTKISAYQVAEDNAAMGLDMITTANEALSILENSLSRARALCIQAQNGTYGTDSIKAIKSELNSLVDELIRTKENTEFNGINLFGKEGMPVANPDTGFIADVVVQNPEVTVSDPTKLLEAIENNSIIGISNAETLAELATIVNNNLHHCEGKTIVLTNDIDLSGYANWTPIGYGGYKFRADFNGNGHIVSNLTITTASNSGVGVFGCVNGNVSISNLGVIDVNINTDKMNLGGIIGAGEGSVTINNCYVKGDISGSTNVGLLVGLAQGSIYNCYSEGFVNSSAYCSGGIVGCYTGDIFCCYSNVELNGVYEAGGLVGLYRNSSGFGISSCYARGNVTGTSGLGGVIGKFLATDSVVSTCFSIGSVTGTTNWLVGDFIGKNEGRIDAISGKITEDLLNQYLTEGTLNGGVGANTTLQVGINSNLNSEIGIDFGLSTSEISALKNHPTSSYSLAIIDHMLSKVSAKQTEFGATSNRLNSALEEISTQYENLVSTRSTIKDADMAELSSTYIQKQILQQASATLLATANQTPAIALQLI